MFVIYTFFDKKKKKFSGEECLLFIIYNFYSL